MGPAFLTQPIFGNDRIGTLFNDASIAEAMAKVEQSLAQVQASLGIVPGDAAQEITDKVANFDFDFERLSEGVAIAGVPVPALLDQLRAELSQHGADWLHFGATSQDIVDTAMCLCGKDALDQLGQMLSDLIGTLKTESAAHSQTLMLGRTRGQLATPITYGLRVAQWAQPLIALEAELPSVRQAALRVQFGGASGSQSVLGLQGVEVSDGLARALDLFPSPPWHTDRGGFRRLAEWLLRLSQALAKIGHDVAIMTRGEIRELVQRTGGGSSTMPHKANPVRAEALVAAAEFAKACSDGLGNAAVHGEERDGSNWSLEWVLLPSLFEVAGASLAHASALMNDIEPDVARMQMLISETPAVMSEAAVFALASKLGRGEATRIVKLALSEGTLLEDVLSAHLGLDASEALKSEAFTNPSAAIADAIFATRPPND